MISLIHNSPKKKRSPSWLDGHEFELALGVGDGKRSSMLQSVGSQSQKRLSNCVELSIQIYNWAFRNFLQFFSMVFAINLWIITCFQVILFQVYFLDDFDIVVHGVERALVRNLRNPRKSFVSITNCLCGLEHLNKLFCLLVFSLVTVSQILVAEWTTVSKASQLY